MKGKLGVRSASTAILLAGSQRHPSPKSVANFATLDKLRRMRLRLMGGKSATLRACVAVLLFCSVALSAGLSAAPQLHEWLHKVDQTSPHECAATLLSSGSWETADCEPPTAPPSAVLLAP